MRRGVAVVVAAWLPVLLGCAVKHTYTAHLEHAADSGVPVVTYFVDGQYVRTVRYWPDEERTLVLEDMTGWQQFGSIRR